MEQIRWHKVVDLDVKCFHTRSNHFNRKRLKPKHLSRCSSRTKLTSRCNLRRSLKVRRLPLRKNYRDDPQKEDKQFRWQDTRFDLKLRAHKCATATN